MKSAFAKIQTYNKHTHRHERKWNEMKACRRNNDLEIRYAVRAIPVFLSCTRVYWYSRSNFKLCFLICSVVTYVYIYVLVHAYIHMNTHPYIHRYAYTQVTYRDMYTYEGIYIYSIYIDIDILSTYDSIRFQSGNLIFVTSPSTGKNICKVIQ